MTFYLSNNNRKVNSQASLTDFEGLVKNPEFRPKMNFSG